MQLIRNLSIKHKLTSIILLVAGIVILVGFSAVIFNHIRTLRAVLAENMTMTAKLMAEYCATPLEFDYKIGADEILQKLESIPDATTGIVYDKKGNIFAAFDRSPEEQLLPPLLTRQATSFVKEPYLHVYQPIMSDNNEIGTIYLKISTRSLHLQIKKNVILMAVFLVGILILSYFLAVKFQSIVSNPILQLADVTKIVSEKADYSFRVQKMSNDEIGLLYDSFNEMLQRIQEREAERDRATAELQAKTEELSQTLISLRNTQTQLLQAEKMAAIANLVAGVTHEINNPIGAVKSAADVSNRSIKKLVQVLKHSKNIQEARRSHDFQNSLKFLRTNNQVITAASQRVSKIIRSLRNFVRLDESDVQIVDIREGIESALTLIQHEFKERIQIIKSYGEVPRIVCYVRELNQALMSLLLYSAKTIEREGVIQVATGTISRQHSNVTTHIFVRIEDNGKGIPREKLPLLFEIGFMANSTRIELGLELSAVQNIINKHNGTIEVESEEGEGSTFTIKLPLEQNMLYQRSTMTQVAD